MQTISSSVSYTHLIVDIDYGKIRMYVGNYDFWYESSQLMQNLIRSKNKRNEEKIAELQAFISVSYTHLSPVRVSMEILSPSLMNRGTRTSAPVSSVAGFSVLVAVLPARPG